MINSKEDEPRENPRTLRVRKIVLDEGLRLLVSEGGEAVTALRIAESTGVARSTIYRHWPDQPALLLDVVERAVTPHRATQLTGDLAKDLETALVGLRSRIRIRAFRRVFAALLFQAERDAIFVKSQQRLLDGLLFGVREVIEDALARGDLPPTLDIDSACVQLAGPLLTQHVMLQLPIGDALIGGSVHSFLATHQVTT